MKQPQRARRGKQRATPTGEKPLARVDALYWDGRYGNTGPPKHRGNQLERGIYQNDQLGALDVKTGTRRILSHY